MRKAAIGFAVVLAVLALLAVLLPRFVSLSALKRPIVAALEAKTGRRVDFKELTLSLFPGIGVTITGLSVSGDPGHSGERLLSVPEAEVRVAIWPLLSGRTELTRIILKRPEILFRKYRDGTHSATETLNRLARRDKAPAGKPAEGVSVALKSVNIEEAKLVLLLPGDDGRETRWEIAPFTFRLSGIGGNRHDFEIDTRIEGAVRGRIAFEGTAVRPRSAGADSSMFDVGGKGKVFGQPVTVEGKMSAPAGPAEFDLTIDFPKIAMDKIPEIFAHPPPALSAARPEGVGKLSAKVSGSVQALGFEIDADLSRAGWTVGPEVRKFIDASCTLVAQGRLFADQLVLSNAELRFPPLLVIANAVLSPDTGAREWAASARLASLSEFATSRGGGLSVWSPSGRLTASGKGKRPSAEAKETWNVAMDLGEVGFQIPERRFEFRSINGHVEASPGAVEFLPLAGLFNGQRFFLRGKTALGEKAVGQVDFRMGYLDVDSLFPAAADQGKEGKGTKGAAPERKAETGRQEIAFDANVAVDAGKAKGVEFRDLTGKIRYEKGNFSVDSVKAKLYGGEATVSGRIRTDGPAPGFKVRVAVKDVSAGEILSRKTSLKDFLTGPASLTADVSGGMKDFPDFARTAAGSGAFRVTGGRLKGVDLLDTATRLAGVRALLPAAPGGGRIGETSFSDLSADFRIDGGKIRSDAVRVVSERLALTGAAAVGFDRTLEFRGILQLSKEMSDRLKGVRGSFLIGPSGRAEIPVVMSGPLTSPAVAVDTQALAAGSARKILRGLSEKIPGLSPEPARPGPKEEPGKAPAPPDPGKGLDRLFQKLLPGR